MRVIGEVRFRIEGGLVGQDRKVTNRSNLLRNK